MVHYWRTANGAEVDLVIEQAAGMALAVECKWKEHPDSADAAGLRALEAVEQDRIKEKFIVCRTKAVYKLADGTWVMNMTQFLKNFGVIKGGRGF